MRARDRLEPGAHQTGLRCGTPVARAGLRGASSMAARRKPPRFRAREADPRLAEEVARLRAENEQLRRQQAYSDLSDAASSFNSRTSLSRSYDQELADLRGSNERLLAEQRSLARTVQELRDAAVATPSPPRRRDGAWPPRSPPPDPWPATSPASPPASPAAPPSPWEARRLARAVGRGRVRPGLG